MTTPIQIVYLDEDLNVSISCIINVNLKRLDVWYVNEGKVVIEIGGKAWETTLTESEFILLQTESLTASQN